MLAWQTPESMSVRGGSVHISKGGVYKYERISKAFEIIMHRQIFICEDKYDCVGFLSVLA